MTLRCGKCGGGMQEGFQLDSIHNSARVAHWAEGAPEFWFLRILKLRGRRKIPIRTWRCSKCGYLESFAEE
jgi:hypothetical protein